MSDDKQVIITALDEVKNAVATVAEVALDWAGENAHLDEDKARDIRAAYGRLQLAGLL